MYAVVNSDAWGLNSDGELSSGTGNILSAFLVDSNNAREAIVNDLRETQTQAQEETKMLEKLSATDSAKGKRLLFLFQRDLLPGVYGKILDAKDARDNFEPGEYTATAKAFAWLVIFLLNAGMLFYIFLFALQESNEQQAAWLQSFLVWLLCNITLVSTSMVLFFNVLIPSIILNDVEKIKLKLLQAIHQLETDGDKEQAAKDGRGFNSAEYFFVSHIVAKQFRGIKESEIILRFSTPWPKLSYKSHTDVKDAYSQRYSAILSGTGTVLLYMIENMLAMPPMLQELIVQITSTGCLGYAILLFTRLYAIWRPLVLAPPVLLALVVHFSIATGKANAKSQLAKIAAISAKHSSQVHPVSSQPEAEMICLDQQKNLELVTRRESIQIGKKFIAQLVQLQEAREDEDKGNGNQEGLPIDGCEDNESESDSSDDIVASIEQANHKYGSIVDREEYDAVFEDAANSMDTGNREGGSLLSADSIPNSHNFDSCALSSPRLSDNVLMKASRTYQQYPDTAGAFPNPESLTAADAAVRRARPPLLLGALRSKEVMQAKMNEVRAGMRAKRDAEAAAEAAQEAAAPA